MIFFVNHRPLLLLNYNCKYYQTKGGMDVHETQRKCECVYNFSFSVFWNRKLSADHKSFVVLSEQEYLVSAIKNNFASNIIRILSITAVLLSICFWIYLLYIVISSSNFLSPFYAGCIPNIFMHMKHFY